MTENNQQNNSSWQTNLGLLKGLRNKIFIRAAFSAAILLLTAVLLFAMTAAWYTNVVDTGELVFTAKQWGFDGTISVENNIFSIAPGDGGIVAMEIQNNGQVTATAGVTVSKSNLSDLMKQRLYFYVDTSCYRNAEIMDRVYVSSRGGYTYTVFPNSSISVTQSTHNVPPLKWEWVYDVLGYYVYGKITDISIQIDEYIRPIEYVYDPMTTTFTSVGELETIDGIQSVDDFLLELSATDGYEGQIDVSQKTMNGYYPVYVNSEGYGVWAYLCTYQEILQNIKDDTEIGTASNTKSYSVEINITGANSTESATNVADPNTLISIIESTGYSNIKLVQNITLNEELVLKSGFSANIDLNGYSITSNATNIISLQEGAEITLRNGTLFGNGQSIGIDSSGAEVTLNNIVLRNVEEGIRVADHTNVAGVDSRIHIVNSQIIADSDGLWIYGNNSDSDTKTTVVVERSTIIGNEYAGILCNGSYKGTDIQVNDSTITGYYAAIYHPQKESTLQINRSTLTGITGLVVKGGTVSVNDSVISGIGTEDQISEPQYSNSGFTDTGDGIYLEANYEWEATITVTGNKTVVTSANAFAVRKYMFEDSDSDIYIHSGTYNTDVSEYLADGVMQSENESGEFVVSSSN